MSHDEAFAAFVAEKREREQREAATLIRWRRLDRQRDGGRGWLGRDGDGNRFFVAPAGGDDAEVYEFGRIDGTTRIGQGLERGARGAQRACQLFNYPEEDPTDGDD